MKSQDTFLLLGLGAAMEEILIQAIRANTERRRSNPEVNDLRSDLFAFIVALISIYANTSITDTKNNVDAEKERDLAFARAVAAARAVLGNSHLGTTGAA